MWLRIFEFFKNHKWAILITGISVVVLLILFFLYIFVFKEITTEYDNKQFNIVSASKLNSFDQIDNNYKDGKIDYETSLVEKVKYAFGDKKIREKYKSSVKTFEDDGVMNQIVKNYAKLSAKTKKELAPYFKRPSDPKSYLYQKIQNIKTSQASAKKFNLVDVAQAYDRPTSSKDGKIFKYLDTADNKIRVWYWYNKNNSATSSLNKKFFDDAKQVIVDLNKSKAYTKFKKLLKNEPVSDKNLGGDNKLDIYLDPTNVLLKDSSSKIDSDGVNVPDIDINNNFFGSSFIIINISDKNNIIKSTVVHEIFHAFQRSFIFDSDVDNWWLEATAVWAENFIYPTLDSEQEWVSDFIVFPNKTLTSNDGNKEYGAYLFPLYLSKTYGDIIIQKIFKATEISGKQPIIQTIGQTIPMGNATWIHNFKDFTLWNYNVNPVEYYKLADQSGKFPHYSSSDNVFPLSLDYGKILTIKIKKLDPLSAQVVTINNFVTDKDANKIEFTNVWSQKAEVKKSHAGIKAIIYPQSGNPWVEDWTNELTRDFCLNQTKNGHNENIKSVILILSNAGINESFPSGSFIVEAKKNSKDCKKEIEPKTKNFSLSGSDIRKAKYGECDWGKPKGTGNSRTFSITGKFTGKPGIIPEALEVYPYMGIWEATYSYNGPNYAKTGSVKFDMSEAFNDITAKIAGLDVGDPIFEFKPNPYVEYHLFSGVWGSLTDIKKDSATIHINLYDWDWNTDCGTAGPRFDRSDVLMYIK